MWNVHLNVWSRLSLLLLLPPLLILQFANPLRVSLAWEGSSLVASHRWTMFLQSLILSELSVKGSEALRVIFVAASSIAFWQACSQHSFTGSTFSQAARSFDVSTVVSNSSTLTTGQEEAVRFVEWREHILPSWLEAPLPTKICSKSERQCLDWVLFRARRPVSLLASPRIIVRDASSWGQHMTLASNGAKTVQQLCEVVWIKLSEAVKFSEQSPERLSLQFHTQ